VFSELSTTSSAERKAADETLSQAVLRPLLPLAPADIKRLVIIPDGPLHYVSFAVLPTRDDARDSLLSSPLFSTHDSSGRPIEDHVWAGDLITRQFNARVARKRHWPPL